LNADRRRHGLNDGELPIPAAMVESRSTAARFTPGAICLSSSSHFAVKLYSNCMKPVAFPPGRDRLSTIPEPTGSSTITKTIGTVRVACSSRSTGALRSEEHTSELQSRGHLVCRLLLEKKKKKRH